MPIPQSQPRVASAGRADQETRDTRCLVLCDEETGQPPRKTGRRWQRCLPCVLAWGQASVDPPLAAQAAIIEAQSVDTQVGSIHPGEVVSGRQCVLIVPK